MTQHLPKEVDALKLTQQHVELRGTIPLAQLPRLNGLLVQTAGVAEAVFKFGQDEDRNRVVTGTIETTLTILCQRCLLPMQMSVDVSINLAFVRDDERAKMLPKSLDPVLLGNEAGYVDLYGIVEDELMLSVPIAAVHSECDDGETGQNRQFGSIEEHLPQTEDNPFKALEKVKSDLKKTR